MTVGHLGNGIQIGHVAIGIAQRFGIHHLGVGTDGCLQCLQVVHVHNGIVDALCGKGVGDEVEAAAIEIVGCHNMVAGLQHILQGIGHSSRTAGYSQSGHASLQRSHTGLKHPLGAVGEASVDIACIAEPETVGCMLAVAEHITGGLIDGHGTCVRCGVWGFLAYMQCQCLDVKFLSCHVLMYFIV